MPGVLVKPQSLNSHRSLLVLEYDLKLAKPTVSAMSTHLLLLSLLMATSLSCSSAVPPPVYDTDGHEVTANASYYVLPAVRGRGGGLTMAPHGFRCPLFVAQEADELRRGFPVRFTPLQQGGRGGGALSPSSATVHVSFDVRVHFYAATTCVQTTEWHVVGDGARRRVVTGPVLEPSPSGREKVFRVEKQGPGYKLVSCRDRCQDLGVFREDRGVWLGASNRAHVVVFKKATPIFA